MDYDLFEALGRAVPNAYKKLQPYRKSATSLIEEYVGPAYGDQDCAVRDCPMNLINQAVDAYMMLLAANRPKVAIRTHYPELRPFAKHFEVAMNNLIREIGFEFTVRQWVMDAFFCIGVVKVHLADAGMVQMETDRWMDPGTPFASNVNIDDFVFDISARKWSEVRWAGDMYRIPFEDFEQGKKDGLYNDYAKNFKKPTSPDGTTGERQEEIGKDINSDEDYLEPMIDLCDIWVPRDGKVYTFVVSSRHNMELHKKPVAEMDWEGPEHGPYHILGFNDVPNNIMPLPPALQMQSLAQHYNNLLRKNIDAAENQKATNIYTPAGKDDAQRIEGSRNGEWTRVDNKDEVGVHVTPGVDGGNLAFQNILLELFDRQGGNIPAILGLGQQAETLGQEQLIHGAASRKEGQMQYRVVDAVTSVLRSLGFLLWEDQLKEIAGEQTIPGTDITVPSNWTPEDREGNFWEYNFDVVPYSMMYQPPGKDVETVNQLLQTVYAPFLQQIQAQGGQINFQALNEFYADALDKPMLREILQWSTPPEDTKGPPQTSAKGRSGPYLHKTVSNGGTQQGKAHAFNMAAMGAASEQQRGMIQ